jgi:CBS domain-containing protein
MKCANVMTTEIFCCLPGDSLEEVASVMQSEDIGPVPIVDDLETRNLIGIVTDRDIALRAVARGLDTRKTTAEEVMTRELVTCGVEDEIESALDLMARHQVRRLPIVDGGSRLVGMISQADVATRLNESDKIAEVVEEISRPSTDSAVEPRFR